ncbi:DoxX family membrane protein [Chryseosolibacter indicus]|uniref:TQO small subunit DoxD domain-containing protein n=1 Tax=Chryseosolibacter indicus TaxID=2782351 RepID=A0ABS5VX38_9BACT|nr:TQO small subunit DoxD [Chryseosolibacter indicus]MBT1705978.1 hypothetical protein [Chryseosolibacter indicus]
MSNWKEICKTTNSEINIIFRVGVALVLIPHCIEEWKHVYDHLIIYESHVQDISIFEKVFYYGVIIIEILALLLIIAGIFGKIAAAVLCTAISLHFLPVQTLALLLYKQYEIYTLLITALLFLIIKGSGKYSLDSIITRSHHNKRSTGNKIHTATSMR